MHYNPLKLLAMSMSSYKPMTQTYPSSSSTWTRVDYTIFKRTNARKCINSIMFLEIMHRLVFI
jgi:hypothetical protein